MALRIRLGRFVGIGIMAALPAANLFAHAPHLAFSSQYLNFIVRPGANPAPQTLVMVNATHGYMPWSAAVKVSSPSGGNWLSITPSNGALPGLVPEESVKLTVSVTSSSLAAGVYYGAITITAPGSITSPPADNSPQVIEVALTITTTGQPAPGFGLSSQSLAFAGPVGLGKTYTTPVQITNLGAGTLTWTVATSTADGANWLSATATGDSSLNATATVGNLAKGSYTGQVILTAPGAANSPKTIPVSLTVRDPLPPLIGVSSATLGFSAMADKGNPPAQTLNIANLGDLDVNWRVDVTTLNGGPWLTVTPTTGFNSAPATVTATVASLTPGTYSGRITISADGASNTPVVVGVTFLVRPPQAVFDSSGVVNAASYQAGALVPGEIISIFGSRLGPSDSVVFALDPVTQKVPTTLGGTTVAFDGKPAPLFFVSDKQVNLQVPYELIGSSSAQMVVGVAGLSQASLSVGITDSAPGVFTVDGVHAAALNQDSTLNTADNPAAAGSVIQLYLTGQGFLNAKVETGALAPTTPPFPAPVEPVGVNMDGFQAKVDFSGLAPGYVGLTQVNAEIPRGITPSNHVRVVVGVGFNQSAPVMIAVK
jgi:uncharacterized protein (TIGR03437 family)